MKSDGWEPPDVAGLLGQQGWRGEGDQAGKLHLTHVQR